MSNPLEHYYTTYQWKAFLIKPSQVTSFISLEQKSIISVTSDFIIRKWLYWPVFFVKEATYIHLHNWNRDNSFMLAMFMLPAYQHVTLLQVKCVHIHTQQKCSNVQNEQHQIVYRDLTSQAGWYFFLVTVLQMSLVGDCWWCVYMTNMVIQHSTAW